MADLQLNRLAAAHRQPTCYLCELHNSKQRYRQFMLTLANRSASWKYTLLSARIALQQQQQHQQNTQLVGLRWLRLLLDWLRSY